MRGFVRKSFAAALFLAANAANASAQASAATPACEPNQSTPASVGRAYVFLAQAFQKMPGGNASKDLHAAIAQLGDPKSSAQNPVAANLMLGQAYVLLLQTPGVRPVMRRGDLGFTTNPDSMVNIYTAIDSVFDIVEARAPECIATTAQWRQQPPWLAVTKNAVDALNSNKLDSAEMYANWSLSLSQKVPFAYSVLADVAKARKDHSTAIKYWQQTLTNIGTDTSYNDVRLKTLYDMSMDAVERADAATGAAKQPTAREAIVMLKSYLTSSPNDYQTTAALQNMARMYVAAGDTARMADIYAPMLQNPSIYGESTLLQAGVTAVRLNRNADAVRFFDVALKANPYQRDALNNLAASYINEKQFDKVSTLVSRLLALDPDNPDNVLLNAYLYSGLLRQAKTAKDRKLYTDSLVYYTNRSEKMPVKVSFTEFSRNETETNVSGSVENRGTVSKTFNIYFEFVDKTGAVVASQQTSVGPIAAKGKQNFKVSVTGKDIVGYRYRPIT